MPSSAMAEHLERELGLAPVDVDDRGACSSMKRPHPFEEQPVLFFEHGGEVVEIALHRRRDGCRSGLGHFAPRA